MTMEAHHSNNLPSEEPRPKLKTLKDYNAYIKKLDFEKLSIKDKEWLEETYNKLINKVEEQHHHPESPANIVPTDKTVPKSTML